MRIHRVTGHVQQSTVLGYDQRVNNQSMYFPKDLSASGSTCAGTHACRKQSKN